jgi:hypothetical protein
MISLSVTVTSIERGNVTKNLCIENGLRLFLHKVYDILRKQYYIDNHPSKKNKEKKRTLKKSVRHSCNIDKGIISEFLLIEIV